ncbi:MAG: MFS transporter [Woeseia sp.]
MLPKDLRGEYRWLSSGFLLTFCSGFGQTYYIALYAGHIKSELTLTDGAFGSLYMAGTLLSAVLLAWAGKFADSVGARWLGAGVLVGLLVTCVLMSAVASAWMLTAVFFGLRFFGQGMCTHVAMTAMGRWFDRKRGRAVSIAALGLPLSEALLPLTVVMIVAAYGWREAWLVNAGFLLLVAVPLLVASLKHERRKLTDTMAMQIDITVAPRRHWSRSEVLRHPLFYAVLPVVLATPFIFTAIFINQVSFVDDKGWKLSWFAASYPAMAGMHMVAALAAGKLVDRFGARHLLVLYLLPLGFATLLFVYVSTPWILPVAMALLGTTMGVAATTGGALWPELYGVVHLGAIRSIATALMVVATAVAPGLVGVLMDAGVALQSQMLVMGVYCFAASLWALFLQPGMAKVATV